MQAARLVAAAHRSRPVRAAGATLWAIKLVVVSALWFAVLVMRGRSAMMVWRATLVVVAAAVGQLVVALWSMRLAQATLALEATGSTGSARSARSAWSTWSTTVTARALRSAWALRSALAALVAAWSLRSVLVAAGALRATLEPAGTLRATLEAARALGSALRSALRPTLRVSAGSLRPAWSFWSLGSLRSSSVAAWSLWAATRCLAAEQSAALRIAASDGAQDVADHAAHAAASATGALSWSAEAATDTAGAPLAAEQQPAGLLRRNTQNGAHTRPGFFAFLVGVGVGAAIRAADGGCVIVVRLSLAVVVLVSVGCRRFALRPGLAARSRLVVVPVVVRLVVRVVVVVAVVFVVLAWVVCLGRAGASEDANGGHHEQANRCEFHFSPMLLSNGNKLI